MLRFQDDDVDACFLGDAVSPLQAASVFISIARVAPPTAAGRGSSSHVPDDLLSFCVKPGDFLKDRLPEADLYIACGLLWGRPDDEALLSRIAGSCPPGEAACRGPCPKRGDGFC